MSDPQYTYDSSRIKKVKGRSRGSAHQHLIFQIRGRVTSEGEYGPPIVIELASSQSRVMYGRMWGGTQLRLNEDEAQHLLAALLSAMQAATNGSS